MTERPFDASADDVEVSLFAAELGDAPQIDLHGKTKEEALRELEEFFHAELVKGTEVIKIIHGRGDQVLRNAIWIWLCEPVQKPLIKRFRDSSNPMQQGAVTLIALERLKR